MVRQPILGQGLLIVEITKSHSDTPNSAGLLRTSDQPDAETSAWKKHNIHKRQTSKFPVWFEPATPASERPQTYALESADTGICYLRYYLRKFIASFKHEIWFSCQEFALLEQIYSLHT